MRQGVGIGYARNMAGLEKAASTELDADGPEPVIATICGVLWATRARPVSRSPHTTLSTPGGRNSWHSSASRVELAGVVSDGLSTTVLPAASAGAIFQIIISSG